MLQHTATHCHTLPHIATSCNTFTRWGAGAPCKVTCNTLNMLQNTTTNSKCGGHGLHRLPAIHCNTLQHAARILQHTATHSHGEGQGLRAQLPATHYNTQQHTATCCNTITRCRAGAPCAIDCNTLQHAATRCNTLTRCGAGAPCAINLIPLPINAASTDVASGTRVTCIPGMSV